MSMLEVLSMLFFICFMLGSGTRFVLINWLLLLSLHLQLSPHFTYIPTPYFFFNSFEVNFSSWQETAETA